MDEAFRIIETFGWWPGAGARRLERHLARMARTARVLGVAWDAGAARRMTDRVAGTEPLRCRLTLDRRGRFALDVAPLGPAAAGWRVDIAPDRLCSGDRWLRMKTTRRALYDRARATLPPGVDERLFLNEHGHLCEGAITSLFVDCGQGLLTPPLSDGLLPGILREELLRAGRAREAHLTPDDLGRARAIFVGNSLRGLIPARRV